MAATDVEAALLAIRAANDGVLTARAIVDAAADPAHELHERFLWDDARAGDRYRLQQARQLVRVVRLAYIDKRGHPDEIRVFHSLPDPRSGTGRSYVPLEELKRNEVLTRELRRQMEIEWRALKRKYDQFEDWWKMVRRDMGPEEDDGEGPDQPLAIGDEA